jgi:3-phenylpropionate/cinnamic acid dioxygenase small subunit
MSDPKVQPAPDDAATAQFKRVRAASSIYGDIQDFLNDEAALLDDDLHMQWLDLLAEDLEYQVPVRETVYRRDGRGFSGSNFHFRDNKDNLATRVHRSVVVAAAYDRDPAPRIRRLITNLIIHETAKPDEYAAVSSFLLLRNRFDAGTFDMLAGKREDIIRKTSNGLKLAKRLVLLDQTNLGAAYLNVFM